MTSLAIPPPDYAIGIVAFLLFYLFLEKLQYASPGIRYPPGPRGLPFLGLFKMPSYPAWLEYRKMSEHYGSDILRLRVLTNNVVILNSFKAATDLLGKRSSIYSDRPVSKLIMLKDLCGLDWNIGLLPYGREWRDSRKVFGQELGVNAVKKYRSIQRQETHKFLARILRNPEKFWDHSHSWSAGQIISIAYGIEIQSNNDPHVIAAEHASDAVGAAVTPGCYLVDFIPLLRHMPEWVPGAKFQREARLWRKSIASMRDEPWEIAKQQLTESSPRSISVANSLIEAGLFSTHDSKIVDSEEVAKSTLGSMYLAGSESTLTGLRTFLLAMLLNPDVLSCARQCVDRVCKDRLPDFSDYGDLPYVHAIIKECLRWSPILTLNVAHQSVKDDTYCDFFIPRGSIVIANIRAMLQDPQVYPDPDRFYPERFLNPSTIHLSGFELNPTVRDPMDIAFGFGRRICPGRYMAYDSLWLAIASILSVFDIEPGTDAEGRSIQPQPEFEDGLVCRPKPFECRMFPRSPSHESWILTAHDFGNVERMGACCEHDSLNL